MRGEKKIHLPVEAQALFIIDTRAVRDHKLCQLLMLLLLEFRGILANDACAEHVGHTQNLHMYLVVGRHVCRPVSFQVRHHLIGRQVQMLMHHLLHPSEWPAFGICAAEEGSDLIHIGISAIFCVRHLGRVIRFGGSNQFGGSGNVCFQERGQFPPAASP